MRRLIRWLDSEWGVVLRVPLAFALLIAVCLLCSGDPRSLRYKQGYDDGVSLRESYDSQERMLGGSLVLRLKDEKERELRRRVPCHPGRGGFDPETPDDYYALGVFDGWHEHDRELDSLR